MYHDTDIGGPRRAGRSRRVARTGVFIDLRDDLGAIERGRYCLRAATMGLVHTAELCGSKRVGADKSILLRRRDHDRADLPNLGGNKRS